jgi:hypothetical protein
MERFLTPLHSVAAQRYNRISEAHILVKWYVFLDYDTCCGNSETAPTPSSSVYSSILNSLPPLSLYRTFSVCLQCRNLILGTLM